MKTVLLNRELWQAFFAGQNKPTSPAKVGEFVMRRTLVALACAIIAYAGHAGAQSLTPAEVSERQIQRRAVEAVIWGIPVVNFDRMLQAAIQNGGAANQIIYWSQPVNWQDQTLTPNPDTIYLNPFYDTRSGPVVLEIPPADESGVIVGSVDTAWQNALEDVGPAGADKGKGGKYLITPPGYKDQPPEGYIVLPSDTYQGFVILRSNFKSRRAADIAAAVAYGKRIKFYPLGAKPDATVFVDVYNKPYDSTIPYDVHFFESLHRVVQIEPWLTRDKVMIEMLKTIGIEKGMPFRPDATMKAVLDDAAREAHTLIGLWYEKNLEPSFYSGTHWGLPVPKEAIDGMSSGFADPNSYAIDGRAVFYYMAYFSVKHFGAGQFYLVATSDRAGQPLKGNRTYHLTVPANAPVNQYWSVTAYDRETHALIKNMPLPSRASNSPDVQKNADGSGDLCFGPKAPAGKESNWVPTDPQRDFELLFRAYGPKPEFFEKKWQLPDLENVK